MSDLIPANIDCVACFTENESGSEHRLEKEEWKKIKEHPQHGRSQANGVEGMV